MIEEKQRILEIERGYQAFELRVSRAEYLLQGLGFQTNQFLDADFSLLQFAPDMFDQGGGGRGVTEIGTALLAGLERGVFDVRSLAS